MSETSSRPLRWGILSSSNIARKALIPAISAASNAEVVCLGTPNPDRVAEHAEQYGYRVLPSYEAVLDDPEVDVVYNPLPNGMHAPWSIRAMEAGKHVLCEKPFTVQPAETQEMMRVAEKTGRTLMEAFMYRFHPQIALARQLLDSGRIGPLRILRASFSFNLPPDPSNLRYQADQGPGALMDVGCYCINAARFFSGGAPVAVQAWSNWHRESGGDLTTGALLEYESHVALFDCSFESAFRSGVELVGDRGTIELTRPWLPGQDPAVVRVTDADGMDELKTEGVDQYRLMVEHFCECARENRRPALTLEDTLENMRVIAAVRRAALEGRRLLLSES